MIDTPAHSPVLNPVFPGRAARHAAMAAVAGGVAMLACAALASMFAEGSARRFLFAYLTAWAFFLSLALAALFFVLLQHLTRAGWSVMLRRIAEIMAAALPVFALLAVPMVVSVIAGDGALYPWARADGAIDPAVLAKKPFLNVPFFLCRLALYFAAWSVIALWFWRQSVAQDVSGDTHLTTRMERRSAPAMVLYAITVTFAAFDLLMSLDAHWYSTIFGVYFFSGAAAGGLAMLILTCRLAQRLGLMPHITVEHYHDLGKLLFGFVFFWGYIAFSQYMLIWYANIPEETAWLIRRGATTAAADMSGWTPVCAALIAGHLFIPFVGLLSRRVKRSPSALAFWAAWVAVFHWIDIWWLTAPQMGAPVFGLPEICCILGVGGIYFGACCALATRASLLPVRDPRIAESLRFENV